MGVCQSSMCQCIDEDLVHKTGHYSGRPAPLKTTGSSSSNNNKNGASSKLKIDLMSPAGTEATTPGSTLYTPSNGPLSLISVISSAGGMSLAVTATTGNNEAAARRSKFDFSELEDLDSFIVEEEDADAPSDEEDFHDTYDRFERTKKEEILRSVSIPLDTKNLPADPKSIILNPPLVVPAKGEADKIVLESKSQSRAASVNDRMLREFNKLKDRVSLVKRNKKKSKQEAKLEDRTKDVTGYRNLYTEYKGMEALHKATELQKAAGHYLAPPMEDSFLTQDGDHNTNDQQRHRIRKSNSFDLNDSNSWFVDFRKEMKFHRADDYDDDDNRSCQSGLSLLSEASMDAQKVLFAEKRRRREARFAARRMPSDMINSSNIVSIAETNEPTQNNMSKDSKDYESYFKAIMMEDPNTVHDEGPNTPQLSPPRLEVVTNESKVILDETYDYGPVPAPAPTQRAKVQNNKIITEMEVILPMDDDKKKDDTSVLTDGDFEQDYMVHRRRRNNVSEPKDNASLGSSSLISLGKLPGSAKSVRGAGASNSRPEQDVNQTDKSRRNNNNDSNKNNNRRNFRKTVSSGMVAMRDFPRSNVPPRKHDSLGDRIADLEKRMGIVPTTSHDPQVVQAGSAESNLQALQNQDRPSEGRLASAAEEESPIPIPDLQSPLACPPAATFPTCDLEPTKLEAMFDQTSITGVYSLPPPFLPSRSSISDVREQIVMGNASKCQKQVLRAPYHTNVALMTKEEFHRMSEDHAMVKVSRHPVEQDAYVVQESANDRENCAPTDNEASSLSWSNKDTNNASFANDITDEIHNVLSKYRNDGVVDAHTLLQIGSKVVEGDSFDQAQGKLYSA